MQYKLSSAVFVCVSHVCFLSFSDFFPGSYLRHELPCCFLTYLGLNLELFSIQLTRFIVQIGLRAVKLFVRLHESNTRIPIFVLHNKSIIISCVMCPIFQLFVYNICMEENFYFYLL